MTGRIAGWWKGLVRGRAAKPQLAQPLWRLELGHEIALIAGEDRLYVVVTGQAHKGRGSVRVATIAPATGAADVPREISVAGDHIDAGFGTIDRGRLFLNRSERIYVEDGSRQYGLCPDEGGGARLVGAPVVRDGVVYGFWELPGDRGGTVTRYDEATQRWLSRTGFAGSAHFPLQCTGSDVFVAAGESFYRLDAADLSIQASTEFPGPGGMLSGFRVANEQVFFSGSKNVQIRPEGPVHKLEGSGPVISWQEGGTRASDFLHCYEARGLAHVKSWPMAGESTGLWEVPGRAAILVSVHRYMFHTEPTLLVGSSPHPITLASWRGQADHPLAWSQGRACWLSDHSRAEWLDNHGRAGKGDDRVDLHMLDLQTGDHRTIALEPTDGAHQVVACGDLLVVATRRQVLAFASSTLWDSGVVVQNEALRAAARRLTSAGDSAPLSGSILHGPNFDDWGYDHSDEFLHETIDPFFDAVLASGGVTPAVFWNAPKSKRIRMVDLVVDESIRVAFSSWRDWDRTLAPTFGLAAESGPKVSMLLAIRFGSLSLDEEVIAAFHELMVELRALGAAGAEPAIIGISRLLLHEHIRRCMNHIEFEKAFARIEESKSYKAPPRHKLPPALTRTLAWCNIDASDPRKISATVDELLRVWPGGFRSWGDGVGAHLRFVEDCVRLELICRPADRSLAGALARLWRDPRLPARRDVFISYSRIDRELAEIVAEQLVSRGLRVGLDQWEIKPDLDHRSVEMWIAETVMSADARIVVLSENMTRSGWVDRELEWDFRLLGARHTGLLPYVVVPETGWPGDAAAADEYPAGRQVPARSLMEPSTRNAAIDELVLRLAVDSRLRYTEGIQGTVVGLDCASRHAQQRDH